MIILRAMLVQPPGVLLLVLMAAGLGSRVHGEELTNRLERLRPQLTHEYSVPIREWRTGQPADAHGEPMGLDDSSWKMIAPGYSWPGEDSNVWFRAKVEVPGYVAGQTVEALPLRLDLGMSGQCELYIDGQLKEAFQGGGCHYLLTEHAHAGQTFNVAIRSVIGPRNRQFNLARLYFNVLPELDEYLDEAAFVSLLAEHGPAAQQAKLNQLLAASGQYIQFTNITPDTLNSVRVQLAQARAELAPVADITKNYDVYYIGHAHIDMNWQWDWPETIDVCHRTWNTAMNLMQQFPDFQFVQSQPGAYVPIEAQYPDEFKRMQAAADRGQWDLVGGLWNESDTDIPSGEGLARSFLLGQSYFKSKFGKYAVTGWLPDSFGHSWQLPQIMKLAGIENFYHMRCGNGMEFTWWEAPDGSRVLKANTPSYDTKPQVEQLLVPFENEARFGVRQSVVIFGVGDHGGGPTREHIMRIQSFQRDPIFPKVHFIGADAFFAQLAKQPKAGALPVVDTDLQYTFDGCYTTHADAKAEIRGSENNLYSAEVLSTLAAFMGRPYPVDGFQEAWKPTAFAQFHDIAAGSAIHSTYDWMRDQLAPAFQFERKQTDQALAVLAENTDTRGPGTNALVVWNTLSFARNDVVRATIPHAPQYHSVYDSHKHQYPAQAADEDTLVFVARAVPGFGQAVYFPSTKTGSSDGIKMQDAADHCDIQTPSLRVSINKVTGAIGQLYAKSAGWNAIGESADANLFQLLGDTGSAWTIKYTGSDQIIATNGANVTILDNGPVFARVRIDHQYGKSSYAQYVTVYGALPRVDVPTTLNWQEEQQLLKVRIPVNGSHLVANAQIPYGSIARPAGRECPGQKWMDLAEAAPAAVADATPLDLSSCFNSSAAGNFDGDGNGYPAGQLPAAGVHRLGMERVPFKLANGGANGNDNVAASGQAVPLPSGATGDTLYVLAARTKGVHGTFLSFKRADGLVESRAFNLNDWKLNTTRNESSDNELGLAVPYPNARTDRAATQPKLWIAQVPVPTGVTGLILPQDSRIHFFAMTLANKPGPAARHGLSVLNDSKYGFDVVSNVFRLTLLRGSQRPDPHPDAPEQKFTYSLYPHDGDWRAAHTDEQALGLNIPLLAKSTGAHPAGKALPSLSVENVGRQGDLVVSALKRSEDGKDFILRFYEAAGRDTRARIRFDTPVRAEAADILERPLTAPALDVKGNTVTLPVGHNQIITLRFSPN